jgi:GTP:adenosylcobinamide-phosphate guanylyltransferase
LTAQAQSALVLAGRRGSDDPLAAARGVSHRALLPVHGVPMLVRVVRALASSGCVGRIHVSMHAAACAREVEELDALASQGRLLLHEAAASPSASVLAVLEREPAAPFLVTTADHALLTPGMVSHFDAAARASGADLAVGFVAASLLKASYPHSTRTYLRLRGEAWSGANLFAFRTARARAAADFWRRAERFRKRPWRLVAALGPSLLAGYALGRLDLDAALSRASRRVGATVCAVRMPVAEAAIDVDRESDFELASLILAAREPRAAS